MSFSSLSVSNTIVCIVAEMTSKDYSGRCEMTELPRGDNDDWLDFFLEYRGAKFPDYISRLLSLVCIR